MTSPCPINRINSLKAQWLLPLAGLLCLPAAAAPPPLVAVDVGHTWAAPGSTSARGRDEYTFNRELAGRIADTLPAYGLRVLPINFDGDIASLDARPRQAREAALFLSVHHDSIQKEYLQPWVWEGSEQTFTDAKRGFGLFISTRNPGYAKSLACASALGAALRQAGFTPTPFHAIKHLAADRENGVWIYDNLVVLHKAKMPALLLEAGVIKHREEELELANPARQTIMAEAVAAGLAACLGGKEKSGEKAMGDAPH